MSTIPDSAALIAELQAKVDRAHGLITILQVRLDEAEKANWRSLCQQKQLADAFAQMTTAAGLAPEHRKAVGQSAQPRSPRPRHLRPVR